MKPVDGSQSPPKPKLAVGGGGLQRTRVADSPPDSSVMQVVNKQVGVVFLFILMRDLLRRKDRKTVYDPWRCVCVCVCPNTLGTGLSPVLSVLGPMRTPCTASARLVAGVATHGTGAKSPLQRRSVGV